MAMTENNTLVSRRHFLRTGTAAVAISTAAVAPALAATHSDAELLALGRQWEAAAAEYTVYLDTFNAAEKRYLAMKPAMPDALKRTEADRQLKLFNAWGAIDGGYTEEQVESFRARPRVKSVEYPITEAERIQFKYPSDAHTRVRSEPWPEAQARADEIVQAWDKWRAGIKEAECKSGLDVAEEKNDRLFSAEHGLREKIILSSAKTIEGVMLKARAHAWLMGGAQNIDLELQEHFERAGLDEVTVMLSIVRDLLHLASPTPIMT